MINNTINSKFLAGLTATVAFTGVMANAGIANAASITSSANFGLETTDITDALLSIEKFDGSLGTLQNVTITFDGQIVGNAQVESLDAQAQTLTFDAGGLLQLVESSGSLGTLFNETVSGSDSFDATAFDDTIDFGGTSGQSFEGLTAMFSGQNIYNDQAVLDFFTGTGDVEFLFSALTDSNVTGAANIASIISTQAGASVTVEYLYEELNGGVLSERVPEPSTLLALGLFAGAGILSKKKLANKA